MPARTNALQKLVLALKRAAVPNRSQVVESRMLLDASTGYNREVDVVLETVTAGHSVLISFECVDHDRPADVGWVDQMVGKHAHLPTNKLVLVSHRGFTAQAREKASALHLEVLELEGLPDSTVDDLLAPYAALYLKVVRQTQDRTRVLLRPAGEDERWQPLPHDTGLFDRDGRLLVVVADVVKEITTNVATVQRLVQEATPANTWATIGLRVPPATLFCRRDSTGDLDEVVAVEAILKLLVGAAPFEPERSRLGPDRFAWARVDVGAGQYVVVATPSAVTVDEVRAIGTPE